MSHELEPLHVREALEIWIDRQKAVKSEETVKSYGYRVGQFVDWLEAEEITNLNDLTGRDVLRFDSERRSEGLKRSSLNNQMGAIRLYLKFCVDVEAVPVSLPAKVSVPQLSKSQRVNEEKLSTERAETILENLARYQYASIDHALLTLAWHTGARLGGLRSLDIRDCYLTEEDLERSKHEDDLQEEGVDAVETPFIFFRHRPDTDTPLKNKEEGERPVGISEEVGQILQEYIAIKRRRTKDEYGRRPLFSNQKGTGRLSKGGLRVIFNTITQPCQLDSCPHGREPEECEATDHGYEARCPSSRSPHKVRTGSVTWHRDCGWPAEVLAERVNATPEVIRHHYDQPDLLKRMESRRDYLDKLNEENDEN